MNRLCVAAHELGGSGPLLLLLHANGFHGRVFLPMTPVLAHHFRCVALDLPGHGVAPAPSGPFSAEDLLGALRDYVDAHGIRDCYCFGHSLGGTMAALLQLERPETFRAMFLYEPVMRPYQQLQGRQGPHPTPATSVTAATTGTAPSAASPQAPDCSGSSGSGLPRGPLGGDGSGSGGGGGGPSPSLAAPSNLLARMARKRQASYPSLEAAMSSLGSKPPFSTFQPQALHAYLACGGLRPAAAPPAAASLAESGLGCLDTATAAGGRAGAGGGGTLTLACSPENEARVYEALHPAPWRPWQQLTTGLAGAGAGGRACSSEARSSRGGADPGSSGSGGGYRPCRLAVAVGLDVGIHADLARWGVQLPELVPGAQLIRFSSLLHLGPMEDPLGVAAAALEFYQLDGGVASAGGNPLGNGAALKEEPAGTRPAAEAGKCGAGAQRRCGVPLTEHCARSRL